MTTIIHSLADMTAFAQRFCDSLAPRQDGATIVFLLGDLGSGKTTLVQSCARYFGITEPITSPTFVIQKEYDIRGHDLFDRLVHIDAYRLDGKHDLEYLGWETLIQNPRTIIFFEWPEKVSGIHAPYAQTLSFSFEPDGTRRIIDTRS